MLLLVSQGRFHFLTPICFEQNAVLICFDHDESCQSYLFHWRLACVWKKKIPHRAEFPGPSYSVVEDTGLHGTNRFAICDQAAESH